MKKKKLILLFAVICLLAVGCEKKGKEEASVKELKCVQSPDDIIETTFKQDMKTYKITEIHIKHTEPRSEYDSLNLSEEEFKKAVCSDPDGLYMNCNVEIGNEKVILDVDGDPDKFAEMVLQFEQYGIKEFDADSLTKIKESLEKEGASCTLK